MVYGALVERTPSDAATPIRLPSKVHVPEVPKVHGYFIYKIQSRSCYQELKPNNSLLLLNTVLCTPRKLPKIRFTRLKSLFEIINYITMVQ